MHPRLSLAAAAVASLMSHLSGEPALAQTSPAFGPPLAAASSAPSFPFPGSPRAGDSDAQVMGDYLALLQRISAAAEVGAKDYLAAFQLRCGRAMTVVELRRAFSISGGEPVLMGLIRAAQLQDASARRALLARLPCPAGAAR